MAFNGTGTFNRLYNWVIDKGNSVPITASRMDAEMDGMATGLSSCITKNGETTITANIPMNSKKFTGLTTGSARTDSISLGQVQDGQFTYLGTTGGSADAYTATPSPAITAYVSTMRYVVKISATNTTTTPYLQISGIGTPASDAVIKKLDSTKSEIALKAGDMVANGIYIIQRNSANTAWILLNPEDSSLQSGAVLSKTIASGAFSIDPTASSYAIDTEGAAATDDLDTINSGQDGQLLFIRSANNARNVVIKHNTGNIYNPAGVDITLDLTTDSVVLRYDSTAAKWIVVAISTAGTSPITLILTATASNSASVSFTNLSSQFSKYIVECEYIVPVSNSYFSARLSTDNGSSYISANYINGNVFGSNADVPSGGAIPTDRINLSVSTVNMINTSTKGFCGRLEIFNPSNTLNHKICRTSGNYTNTSGNITYIENTSIYTGATTAVNAIQFFFSSGNISSGIFKLYGVK